MKISLDPSNSGRATTSLGLSLQGKVLLGLLLQLLICIDML